MNNSIAARILIIDDEADIAETIAFALRRADCTSDIAPDGRSALIALQNQSYDLIILDVGLPDHDGFALLKHLRTQSATPVIMLTAHNDDIERVFGLELGANDYMGKPFSPRELTLRVQNLLKQRITAPTLFQYDPARAEIFYQGQKLPLTLTETRLFAHMLAHPRRIFSREQLLSRAFSDHHPSDPRTIDTHIKTLRHKLRNNHAPDCIITHRALGYSYEPPA